MQMNQCRCCGKRVKRGDDYLKARRWAGTAIFHWPCFFALMKEHDAQVAAAVGTNQVARNDE
jgi:hypothetical protein